MKRIKTELTQLQLDPDPFQLENIIIVSLSKRMPILVDNLSIMSKYVNSKAG